MTYLKARGVLFLLLISMGCSGPVGTGDTQGDKQAIIKQTEQTKISVGEQKVLESNQTVSGITIEKKPFQSDIKQQPINNNGADKGEKMPPQDYTQQQVSTDNKNISAEEIEKLVGEAWRHYKTVMYGGNSSIYEDFIYNNRPYGYFMAELDTLEKIKEYLEETSTPEVVAKYLEERVRVGGILNYEGRLAGPRGEGGPGILWHLAKVLSISDIDDGIKEVEFAVPEDNIRKIIIQYVEGEGWRVATLPDDME